METRARPVVGVLALQGDVREHLMALSAVGAEAITVRRPEELARCEALVLPGGESTTIAKVARACGLFEPLVARIQAGLPVLGTCAGMVLLADRIEGAAPGQETFGGLDVTVRRNGFGAQQQSFEDDLDFEGFDAPVRAVLIRAPWVERTGDGVRVLAQTAPYDGLSRVVAVQQGALIATSFHPEVAADLRVHGLLLDQIAATVERNR